VTLTLFGFERRQREELSSLGDCIAFRPSFFAILNATFLASQKNIKDLPKGGSCEQAFPHTGDVSHIWLIFNSISFWTDK
jgi:hypothetical protein